MLLKGDLNGTKDACTGDSGGGAYVLETDSKHRKRYVVAGIVSYGESCGMQGKPG